MATTYLVSTAEFTLHVASFLLGIFQGGNLLLCKFLFVMLISIVMLLFSDQISGRSKSFQGGKLPQGVPPCGRKPV